MDTLLNIYNKYVKFIDSSDLTASTRKSYVNSIGQFCNFWGLHKDVSTLNDRSFDLFMQKLKGEGYSQQSLDSKSSAINNFAFFLMNYIELSLNLGINVLIALSSHKRDV